MCHFSEVSILREVEGRDFLSWEIGDMEDRGILKSRIILLGDASHYLLFCS